MVLNLQTDERRISMIIYVDSNVNVKFQNQLVLLHSIETLPYLTCSKTMFYLCSEKLNFKIFYLDFTAFECETQGGRK